MGFKILPIRNKSIGKSCNIAKCNVKTNETAAILIYPSEMILTPRIEKSSDSKKKPAKEEDDQLSS